VVSQLNTQATGPEFLRSPSNKYLHNTDESARCAVPSLLSARVIGKAVCWPQPKMSNELIERFNSKWKFARGLTSDLLDSLEPRELAFTPGQDLGLRPCIAVTSPQ
jgi:hypothetical protein